MCDLEEVGSVLGFDEGLGEALESSRVDIAAAESDLFGKVDHQPLASLDRLDKRCGLEEDVCTEMLGGA